MKSVSRIALGAVLALGASSLAFTSAADAQRGRNQQRQQPQAQPPAAPPLNLTAPERAVLVPLEAAARGTDRAAQDAALAAARPVAQSADARYAFARYQLLIADQRSDNAMLNEALEVVLPNPRLTPEELTAFLQVHANLALAGEQPNFERAERSLARLSQLRPDDAEILGNLAVVRMRLNQNGFPLLQRAITAQQAAGRPVRESWLQYALRATFDSNDPAIKAQSVDVARMLVSTYPNAVNWRNGLLAFREARTWDPAAQLDLWRLMRATGAMAGERDWHDFANMLNSGGYPAEAKAVLDDGVARRMIDASRSPFRELIAASSGRIAEDRSSLAASQREALAAAAGVPALRTGDAFYGHGRYPEAIALYRAALEKGGVDANLVNTRLGIAHAAAGQRAEAEAAFRLVGGDRAQLAQMWLLWLQQRPAS